MFKKHAYIFSVLAIIFLIVGCSDKNDEEALEIDQEVTNNQTEISGAGEEEEELSSEIASTDHLQYSNLEERMQLNLEDAEFSGDKFNEDEVQSIIEQLPDDLMAEDYYYQILSLIGEDYRKYDEFFKNVDTSFETASVQPGNLSGDSESGKSNSKVNVLILFDASGSMSEMIDGKTKMDLAKEAVDSFVGSLPEVVNISLTVYGHKGTGSDSNKELSCKSIEEVYPLSTYKENEFQSVLDSFSSAGWTPLAGGMESIYQKLIKDPEDTENIVYIVSDGVETCNGDPVNAAKELNQSNTKAIVNIIGFDVDDEGQQQLKEVAKAGEGEYSTVRTEQELTKYFNSEKTKLINQWYGWEAENVNKYYASEADRINELYDMETEMINLTYDEEARIKNLTYNLDQSIDTDWAKVREMAEDTADELRGYVRSTADTFREEIRSKADQNRDNVRDKADKEREELRDNE
ncbi:Ca-activated chloride channel family protein [Gracilibacillus ureilyticus]|uniref:Ca-activated chloride channel family protein n=1 Tax=Gracilibacillus ureilyticus TaxID=531814 RepID=A0A1H9S325_9BACI|nr:VWA domain-containing protein [Gracilibacillus ureilyticus]SER78733.1 Ca-activated chloride channel family protein [Gracilibacillus ureilyticus]